MFVECMLGLESEEIGEFLGSTLLTKVVELLVDIDVSINGAVINWIWLTLISYWSDTNYCWILQAKINWEDILQEEHNKGIFDMELEDVEENVQTVVGVSTKVVYIYTTLTSL